MLVMAIAMVFMRLGVASEAGYAGPIPVACSKNSLKCLPVGKHFFSVLGLFKGDKRASPYCTSFVFHDNCQ